MKGLLLVVLLGVPSLAQAQDTPLCSQNAAIELACLEAQRPTTSTDISVIREVLLEWAIKDHLELCHPLPAPWVYDMVWYQPLPNLVPLEPCRTDACSRRREADEAERRAQEAEACERTENKLRELVK